MNRDFHLDAAGQDLYETQSQSRVNDADVADGGSPGPDCIDGTQEGLRLFLADMAQLTGADGEVLTLIFDDIVATAMPAEQGGLTITAQMPRSALVRMARTAPAGCELAWHADLGCEVLVRHLALAALRSEPDVLDALMDTADLARAL